MQDRIAVIYEAADRVSATRSEAWGGWTPEGRRALILAMQWHESGRFSLEAHEGRKRGDHGSSVCLGQINRRAWYAPGIVAEFDRVWGELGQVGRPEFPSGLIGVDHTLACTAATWAILTAWAGAGRGEGPWSTARILTGYGTGRTATPQPWVWARVRTRAAIKDHTMTLQIDTDRI